MQKICADKTSETLFHSGQGSLFCSQLIKSETFQSLNEQNLQRIKAWGLYKETEFR